MNIKKITAAFIAAALMTPAAALAKDNFYPYNKFMTGVRIPQSGLCDTLKSYAGHEEENVIDYFSGIISAFSSDMDGDGDAELFVVEDNVIEIYNVSAEGSTVYLADVKKNLITDQGESYANIFVKQWGYERLLCVEYFADTGASKTYSLRMYSMNKETKSVSVRAKIEKTVDDESVSESVSAIFDDKTVSYSNSSVNGNEFIVNPDNYESCEAAAREVLSLLGFSNSDFIASESRLNLYASAADNNYRISNFINDVEPQTYIRAVGIRNGATPVVMFDDYSMLADLSAPVADITVTVNGEAIQFSDQSPVIKDDRTLVPARGVFEALGARVDWLGEARKVVINTADKNVTLTLDSDTYYVNGEAKQLDVPATLINDRTMIPIRAISESLGCTVDWDGDNRTVVITAQ